MSDGIAGVVNDNDLNALSLNNTRLAGKVSREKAFGETIPAGY